VVPQGFGVLFPIVLGGDFRSPLLVVFLVCFWDLAFGDLMGEICVNPSWFFWLWDWPLGNMCDRCESLVGFASGELLDSCVFGPWYC
jgi:hypothetical protein